MNIYVGNLSYSAGEQDLKKLFEQFGTVTSARVISDKLTGKSKGFGFVEMPDQAAALSAIEKTNGVDLDGRKLRVNESRPKTDGDRSEFRPR
jgi:RNA recognition motif-containing protein